MCAACSIISVLTQWGATLVIKLRERQREREREYSLDGCTSPRSGLSPTGAHSRAIPQRPLHGASPVGAGCTSATPMNLRIPSRQPMPRSSPSRSSSSGDSSGGSRGDGTKSKAGVGFTPSEVGGDSRGGSPGDGMKSAGVKPTPALYPCSATTTAVQLSSEPAEKAALVGARVRVRIRVRVSGWVEGWGEVGVRVVALTSSAAGRRSRGSRRSARCARPSR